MNLVIDLGWVESSNFHTFNFNYTGELAQTRAQARKNIPKILKNLVEVIEQFRAEFQPAKLGKDPSEFFDYLVSVDLDSFGMEASDFFEERGWYLMGRGMDHSEGYTVWNVARWIDGNSSLLEWFGSTHKQYSIRQSIDSIQ